MAVRAERRAPLNRDRVLHAALALVDEGGVESLSMRKLGQALGVEAMSLYYHVANKDEILDGLVDLVWSEIELPPAEEDWETAIRTFATSAYGALTRHPWACNLYMSRPSLSAPRMRYMEYLLGRLRDAGFSPDMTYLAYHAIDSHILGFTLWLQGHSIDEKRAAQLGATVMHQFPRDDYPRIFEHIEQHLTEGSHKNVRTFDFKLALILDGLKRIPGAPSGQRHEEGKA